MSASSNFLYTVGVTYGIIGTSALAIAQIGRSPKMGVALPTMVAIGAAGLGTMFLQTAIGEDHGGASLGQPKTTSAEWQAATRARLKNGVPMEAGRSLRLNPMDRL
jgi:hypothetical protein